VEEFDPVPPRLMLPVPLLLPVRPPELLLPEVEVLIVYKGLPNAMVFDVVEVFCCEMPVDNGLPKYGPSKLVPPGLLDETFVVVLLLVKPKLLLMPKLLLELELPLVLPPLKPMLLPPLELLPPTVPAPLELRGDWAHTTPLETRATTTAKANGQPR
jgi:hypothetical protein